MNIDLPQEAYSLDYPKSMASSGLCNGVIMLFKNLGSTFLLPTNDDQLIFPSSYVPIRFSIVHHYFRQSRF